MTEVLQNFTSALINYLDESRKLYNIIEVNYLSIPFLRQIDRYTYEAQINISKSSLLSYLTNFEDDVSNLFNFVNYRLIDLNISPDETIIEVKFGSKPELPFELIWEIIKNMNYSQILSFANSNRDYKAYFETSGWKDIFKLRYPELYEKFNTDNKHYQQLFKLYNEMNYDQIINLIQRNPYYQEYFKIDGWIDLFKTRYHDLYNKANLFRIEEESNAYYEYLFKLFDEDGFIYLKTSYTDKLEAIIYFIENLKLADKIDKFIYSAISNGNLDTLKYLLSLSEEYNIKLDDDIDLNPDFINAVADATMRGYIDIIHYLVNAGYQISSFTISAAQQQYDHFHDNT